MHNVQADFRKATFFLTKIISFSYPLGENLNLHIGVSDKSSVGCMSYSNSFLMVKEVLRIQLTKKHQLQSYFCKFYVSA